MEENPESRVHGGRKAIRYLEWNKVRNSIQKQLESHDSDLSVSFEDFRTFLDRINGILRLKPKEEHGADGEHVFLKGFVDETQVPHHDDKLGLLKEAFDAIPKLKDRSDVAYLLPAVVNAIHMYADGNGRTSRALHILLRDFPTDLEAKEELERALGEDGRTDSFDIDPDNVYQDIRKIQYMKHGFKFSDEKNWSPMFPDGYATLFTVEPTTTENSKKLRTLMRSDKVYCFIAARDYLHEAGRINEVLSELDGGKAISITKMESVFLQDDWDAVFRGYFDLKREHVSILIDSFVQPDKYLCVDGSRTIREKLIEEVRSQHER